jgi:hypothetical protein
MLLKPLRKDIGISACDALTLSWIKVNVPHARILKRLLWREPRKWLCS